jgi:hypothetical protein
MNSQPPGTADSGLEDADYAAPRSAGASRSMHPLQVAAFVVLFLILGLASPWLAGAYCHLWTSRGIWRARHDLANQSTG